MDDEVDVFLAHFGVKGMKWGKRQTKAEVSVQPKRTAGEIAARDAKRKQALKTGAKVAGGVAIAAGAALIAYQLSKSGNTQMSSLMMDVAKKSINNAKQPSAPQGNTSLTLTPNRFGTAPSAAPSMKVAAGKGMFDDLIKEQRNLNVGYDRSTDNFLIGNTNDMLSRSRL